jgi:hypothetical protein
MSEITAAIVSHNRRKQLENMIWQLENQIEPFAQIKLYVSGYEDGELDHLAKKYRISYQPDKKDWGHDKRAIAINECETKFIVTASDDDIYVYHFTQAMQRTIDLVGDAQVYVCNWRTQREESSGTYGYHDMSKEGEPRVGAVTSGCMVLDAEFIRSKQLYTTRDFGADGQLYVNISQAGGKIVQVPYTLFFHY